MNKELDKLIEAVLDKKINIIAEDSDLQSILKRTGQRRELKLPKFSLSEKWGNPTSQDRKTIEMFTSRIPGTTIAEKINSINSFVSECDSDCVDNKDVTQILSNLITLDCLSSMISDFNPQTGGFLMEAFLAGLLGGKKSAQIPAADGKVEDIYNYEGEPLSVKFLAPTSDISASQKLLNRHFERYKSPIKYLLVQKQKQDKEVMGLKFYTFTIGNDEYQGDFNASQLPLPQAPVISRSTEIATLDFGSKEQLRAVAGRYIDRLGQRVVIIFDELSQLIDNINRYLITDDKFAGRVAAKNAAVLKKKIDEQI